MLIKRVIHAHSLTTPSYNGSSMSRKNLIDRVSDFIDDNLRIVRVVSVFLRNLSFNYLEFVAIRCCHGLLEA